MEVILSKQAHIGTDILKGFVPQSERCCERCVAHFRLVTFSAYTVVNNVHVTNSNSIIPLAPCRKLELLCSSLTSARVRGTTWWMLTAMFFLTSSPASLLYP